MKAGIEHRVPRTTQVIALLGEPGGPNKLVFPSPRGGALTDAALSRVLNRMGRSETVHGMRAAFKTWAGETTHHARDVIERALAHKLPDAAEAAYERGDLFQKRRALMQEWSDYATSLKASTSKKVASIRRRRA